MSTLPCEAGTSQGRSSPSLNEKSPCNATPGVLPSLALVRLPALSTADPWHAISLLGAVHIVVSLATVVPGLYGYARTRGIDVSTRSGQICHSGALPGRPHHSRAVEHR